MLQSNGDSSKYAQLVFLTGERAYHLWNSPFAQVAGPDIAAGGCMKMVSFQIKA
jgi:hypothetical protein